MVLKAQAHLPERPVPHEAAPVCARRDAPAWPLMQPREAFASWRVPGLGLGLCASSVPSRFGRAAGMVRSVTRLNGHADYIQQDTPVAMHQWRAGANAITEAYVALNNRRLTENY